MTVNITVMPDMAFRSMTALIGPSHGRSSKEGLKLAAVCLGVMHHMAAPAIRGYLCT